MLRLLNVVGALVVAWLVAGYLLIVDPSTDKPRHVDAIVVLGSPDYGGALQMGITLSKQKYASNLLVSAPGSAYDRNLCRAGLRDVHVTCFMPSPATTQGEAQAVSRMAVRMRWSSIIVVTPIYHVSRSRWLFDRCFKGQVYVMGTRRFLDWGVWRQQFLYESGAWFKAIVKRSC
ncbi:YdcF family protein [uncultured Jatrophihabitans sp.]|uniref:YdcF family protein n=1 Tax=uncultured Jatrophihabitans sp. TaxID=1610747 RepID=UPI0035CA17EB